MTDISKPVKRKRRNYIPPASQNVKRKRSVDKKSPVVKKQRSVEEIVKRHLEKKSKAVIMIIKSALWDADLFPYQISLLLKEVAEDKKAAFLEKVRDLVKDLIKNDGAQLETGENEDVAAARESTGEL